jgi:putative ABC transport system substrate-binding protein
MKRRQFIAGLGSAAAWPVVTRAQQRGRLPVIGVLWGDLNERFPLGAFRWGLADAGFVVGENVAIEFRGANLEFARLPALAADFVQRQVDVIFTASSLAPARVAKSATTTIPIVFLYGGDPVKNGLVASLNRPGGNVTGMTGFRTELGNKRLGPLHELVPGDKTIAFLTAGQPPSDDGVLAAARTLGLDVAIIIVRNDRDFERAFMGLAERLVGALIVNNDPLLINFASIIVALAERYKIPAMYPGSGWVRRGGLISYGADVIGRYRQAAAQYVGPILKGAKPADLPVQQPTKFELAINLKTAKTLGLTIPETLLATADQVIE